MSIKAKTDWVKHKELRKKEIAQQKRETRVLFAIFLLP